MKTIAIFYLCLTGVQLAVAQSNTEGGSTVGYGNNVIAVSPVLYNNLGRGFGFNYERMLVPSGQLSVVLPVTFNIRNNASSYNETFNERSVGIFMGLRFYPAGSKGPVKYAPGISAGGYNISHHT